MAKFEYMQRAFSSELKPERGLYCKSWFCIATKRVSVSPLSRP